MRTDTNGGLILDQEERDFLLAAIESFCTEGFPRQHLGRVELLELLRGLGASESAAAEIWERTRPAVTLYVDGKRHDLSVEGFLRASREESTGHRAATGPKSQESVE